MLSADVGRIDEMNKKTKAIIRSVISIVLMGASLYCHFGLHDGLLTGLCFLALGVLGLVTRSMFTAMFLVGLFFISRSIPVKALRLWAHVLFLVVFAGQFPLLLKLKAAGGRIKKDGGDLHSAMWDHDLSVWIWKQLFRKRDAA